MIEVDFVDSLVSGEASAIQTATATAIRRNDGTDSSATFLSGGAIRDGSKVRVRCIAGLAGTASLSFAKVLEIDTVWSGSQSGRRARIPRGRCKWAQRRDD